MTKSDQEIVEEAISENREGLGREESAKEMRSGYRRLKTRFTGI